MLTKVYEITYEFLEVNSLPYPWNTLLLIESWTTISIQGEKPLFILQKIIQNQRFTERYILKDRNNTLIFKNYKIREIYQSNVIRGIGLKEKLEKHYQEELIEDFKNKKSELEFLAKEYVTPYGNIDILLKNKENVYYILELKKVELEIGHIKQIEKYMQYFLDTNIEHKAFLIWTSYNSEVLDYGLKSNVCILNYQQAKRNFFL